MRPLALALAILLLPALAAARRPPLNMPPGWTWPPSARMKDDGRACLAHLDALGVRWTKAPATRKVTTPVYLAEMSLGGVELSPIWKRGPFLMDCLLAAAIADHADVLRAAGVAALRFSEIHDYRNINGGKRRILSRHALGLAVDAFAFVTDDGVEHVVGRDYPDVLLLTLEDWLRGTNGFRLLTPGNDPKHHKDHFHLEVREPAERRDRSRIAAADRSRDP